MQINWFFFVALSKPIKQQQQHEKPPVTLRSKSSATGNSICKSISNDEIQTAKPSQLLRTSFKFKPDENKLISEEDAELNPKRKSATSSDEFKRRKSDNSNLADQENGKLHPVKTTPMPIVYPKSRQSLSTHTTPSMGQYEGSAGGGSTDLVSSPSLRNQTKKSMSKSLQDNSKIVNAKKAPLLNTNNVIIDTTRPSSNEKLSVKTKIKLMESIVKSSTNERSSSSSSSCSSRSPPLSPNTIIEIVPIQHVKPTVTARTTNPAPVQPQASPAVVQPKPTLKPAANTATSSDLDEDLTKAKLKTSSNESIDDVSESSTTTTTLKSIVDAINFKQHNQQQKATGNQKEKRHTVKELMSKFEPKWSVFSVCVRVWCLFKTWNVPFWNMKLSWG